MTEGPTKSRLDQIVAQVLNGANTETLAGRADDGVIDVINVVPRTRILVTDNESVLVDDAIAALAGCGRVYQSNGEIVVVTFDADVRTHRIRPLTVPAVRREVSRAAAFYVRDGKGNAKDVPLPQALPGMVRDAGDFPGVPPLRGVSPVPILHMDGTVFDTRNSYDAATLLAYYPAHDYPAIGSTTPTLEDARVAAREILDVFCDFPFETEADRAATLALILTLIGRHLVDGPTPGFMVKANAPGVGKGKLIETVVAIALGQEVAIMTPTEDEAEDRKQITACLRAGDRVIPFDNVRLFGGPVWDGLLTSTVWSGRVLGKTEQLKLPVRAVVTVTSNGCRLVGDAGRRVLPIRLHTDDAHPENRASFRMTLPRDALHDHPRLFSRALDVLRFGLTLAGPPDYWGSFESWCRVVRRTVTAVMTDPCATRDKIDEADETRNTLQLLLSTLLGQNHMKQEWTASELVKESRPQRDDDGRVTASGNDALAEALAGVVGHADRVTPQNVGTALKTHLARRVDLSDGSKARLESRMLDGRMRWRVEVEHSASHAGEAGSGACPGGAEAEPYDLADVSA